MKLAFDTSFNRVTEIFYPSDVIFLPQADGSLKAVPYEDNGRFLEITASDLHPEDKNLSAVHTLETGDTVHIATQGPPVVIPQTPEVVEEPAPEPAPEAPVPDQTATTDKPAAQ